MLQIDFQFTTQPPPCVKRGLSQPHLHQIKQPGDLATFSSLRIESLRPMLKLLVTDLWTLFCNIMFIHTMWESCSLLIFIRCSCSYYYGWWKGATRFYSLFINQLYWSCFPLLNLQLICQCSVFNGFVTLSPNPYHASPNAFFAHSAAHGAAHSKNQQLLFSLLYM